MSGGILGNLGGLLGGGGQGAGLLGSMGEAPTMGGIYDNAMANQGSLMGFFSGMANGDMEAAGRSFSEGQRTDLARRQIVQKQHEEQQRRTAAQSMAQSLGLPPEIAQNPDAVAAIYQSVQANKLTPQKKTLDEQIYAGLDPAQRQQYAQQKFGGGAPKWEMKNVKNADGSESAVYFNPLDPSKTFPVPGYGAQGGPTRAEQVRQQEVQSADIVVQDIDRALKKTEDGDVKVPLVGWDTGINTVTGKTGQVMQHVGGTNANDVAALTTTIKANATFDKLQQMRKSSPTGAALGAVSDTENKLLGAAIGSLEQSQTKEQFTTNLRRVKKLYNEVIHGRGNVDEDGNPKGGAAEAVQGRGKTSGGVNWSVD